MDEDTQSAEGNAESTAQAQDTGAGENTAAQSTETNVATGEPLHTPDNLESTIPGDAAAFNSIGDALGAFEKLKSQGQEIQPGEPARVMTRGVPASRKFDGLEQDEIPLFKSMSNDAYNRLYPMFLEHKKLTSEHEKLKSDFEKNQNTHFYEQEGAWTLSPEYKTLSSNVQRLGSEVSHWQEQLALAAAGEPWTPLVLDAQGNVVYGEPREGGPAAQAQIMSALTKAHSLQQTYGGKLEVYQEQFRNKHKEFVDSLQGVRKRIFQGADLDKLAKAAESKLQMFPSYLHKRPEVQTLAEALVIIDGMTALLKGRDSKANVAKVKQAIQANSGGGESVIGSEGRGNNGRTVGDVLSVMAKARAGVQ